MKLLLYRTICIKLMRQVLSNINQKQNHIYCVKINLKLKYRGTIHHTTNQRKYVTKTGIKAQLGIS